MNAETQTSEEVIESGNGEGEVEGAVDIKTLGELLAADDETGEVEGKGEDKVEVEDEPGPTKFESKTFNDAAEHLGLEVDELYGLEVTLSEDGEPVTIEELKDSFIAADKLEGERLAFEEQKSADEAALVRGQNELREIIEGLPPGSVKKETLEKIRARAKETAATEQARTLEAIPAWKNAEVRTSEMIDMAEHLSAYGFPTSFLGGVVDHRMFRYIRESMLREQRIRKALERVRPGTAGKTPRTKTSGKSPSRGATAGANKGKGDGLKVLLD